MEVNLVGHYGSDLVVVNAARVSFHKESDWEYGALNTDYGEEYWDNEKRQLSSKDAKLIQYLAAHNHWTPFGHAFLSFRIKAPIFVARQLVKHQVGLVWNEVSRRYVDDEPEFWFPLTATGYRGKPVNAKQGSSGVFHISGDAVFADFMAVCTTALQTYNEYIAQGLAPEQARMVLPQNTMTEWIWSGSLAAFARVCKLRLDPHAQQETREVAQKINALVPEDFQHSWKALMNKGEE